MAHAHRSTALPYPGTIRELYSAQTPAFHRRPQEHTPRSPSSFNATTYGRRNPISPTPSPNLPFAATGLRMDSAYGSKQQQNIPPLQPTVTLGALHFVDSASGSVPVKFEINGTIDKGFFLADNEWTCYRRNYFSCACSYTLNPPLPPFTNQPQVQFVQQGSGQTLHVHGFAMSISAVVADNDGQAIELVQHTPKRDKGPTAAPEKVRLSAKSAHPLGGMFQSPENPLQRFDAPPGFGQAPGVGLGVNVAAATEHTFERIQFKQATANNGKRRAAQQYYHLLVELYADTSAQGASQGGEHWVRIGYRKSAKMIVRGRSPGHYQAERRGSTSSGPGGSAGSLGYGSSSMIGSSFDSGSSGMLPSGGYGGTYDPRGNAHYTPSSRHSNSSHDMSGGAGIDSIMSGTEDHKPPTSGESSSRNNYAYYPSPIYEAAEARGQVEMFTHPVHHQPIVLQPPEEPHGGAQPHGQPHTQPHSAHHQTHSGHSSHSGHGSHSGREREGGPAGVGSSASVSSSTSTAGSHHSLSAVSVSPSGPSVAVPVVPVSLPAADHHASKHTVKQEYDHHQQHQHQPHQAQHPQQQLPLQQPQPGSSAQLPSIFYPPAQYYANTGGRTCGRFESKPTSQGYYPPLVTPIPGINM